MDRDRFERLVRKVVEGLPEELLHHMDNVAVVVQDHPSSRQLSKVGLEKRQTLLGLYEGIPQTQRGAHYGLVLPDKITIFRRPIEAICRSETEVMAEVERVVKHEIAHHFGISDARLRQIEHGE